MTIRIDRDELHTRVKIGGTFTTTEMRAVLDALTAAEDAVGINQIRREIERLEVIVQQRDAFAARLAKVDALHQPAPERLHGATICDDCCADWPCPTNRTKETT